MLTTIAIILTVINVLIMLMNGIMLVVKHGLNDDYEKASKLASEKDYLCLASAMSQVLTDRNVLIMLMIGIVLVNCHYLS